MWFRSENQAFPSVFVPLVSVGNGKFVGLLLAALEPHSQSVILIGGETALQQERGAGVAQAVELDLPHAGQEVVYIPVRW